MERNSYVNLLVGRRGAGKSTYILQRIEKYINSLNAVNRDSKVLIIDAQDNEIYRTDNIQTLKPIELIGWKKGIKRIIISDFSEFVPFIPYCHNSFIVVEDAVRFFNANLKKDVKSLIVDTKQIGIDLAFVYHSWLQVPNNIVQLCDFVAIKKTNDTLLSCKKKAPFPEILAAYEKVKNAENKYYTLNVRIT